MNTFNLLIDALKASPRDAACRAALADHLQEYPADIERLVGTCGELLWERRFLLAARPPTTYYTESPTPNAGDMGRYPQYTHLIPAAEPTFFAAVPTYAPRASNPSRPPAGSVVGCGYPSDSPASAAVAAVTGEHRQPNATLVTRGDGRFRVWSGDPIRGRWLCRWCDTSERAWAAAARSLNSRRMSRR